MKKIFSSSWATPAAVFVVSRAALFFAAFVLTRTGVGDASSFCRLDCLHYVSLADIGYAGDANRSNFFPGFFLLVRGLEALVPLPGSTTAVLVANLASAASFVVLHRLFAKLADATAANWGLAAFAFYPFSFFQACGYPESLAILLTALALWWSLTERPFAAGTALAAAVLTRHIAALAGVPFVFVSRRHTIALLLPAAALGGFCVYCWRTFGDPIAFIHARNNWGLIAWRGLDAAFVRGHLDPLLHFLFRCYLLMALPVAAGTIALAVFRPWRALAAYALPLMVLLSCIGIYAFGRYSASCWPAFLPLGAWMGRRPLAGGLVLAGFAALQIVFFQLHLRGAVM